MSDRDLEEMMIGHEVKEISVLLTENGFFGVNGMEVNGYTRFLF